MEDVRNLNQQRRWEVPVLHGPDGDHGGRAGSAAASEEHVHNTAVFVDDGESKRNSNTEGSGSDELAGFGSQRIHVKTNQTRGAAKNW